MNVLFSDVRITFTESVHTKPTFCLYITFDNTCWSTMARFPSRLFDEDASGSLEKFKPVGYLLVILPYRSPVAMLQYHFVLYSV